MAVVKTSWKIWESSTIVTIAIVIAIIIRGGETYFYYVLCCQEINYFIITTGAVANIVTTITRDTIVATDIIIIGTIGIVIIDARFEVRSIFIIIINYY